MSCQDAIYRGDKRAALQSDWLVRYVESKARVFIVTMAAYSCEITMVIYAANLLQTRFSFCKLVNFLAGRIVQITVESRSELWWWLKKELDQY